MIHAAPTNKPNPPELTPLKIKMQTALGSWATPVKPSVQNPLTLPSIQNRVVFRIVIVLILLLAAIRLPAREKDTTQYGAGLIVNIPFSENEVAQAVEEVTQSGIIRGSKEYNKDEYISGAAAVPFTKIFSDPPPEGGGGKIFYKVRLKALDPRNFKNGGDVGTLAVRYVVKAQDTKNTILRIDARFVEDFRRVVHASNGSVESAEYKDIHDHLETLELARAESEEARKNNEAQRKQQEQQQAKPEQAALTDVPSTSATSASAESSSMNVSGTTTPYAAVDTQPQTSTLPEGLQARVKELRRQVERKVKAPGAPLKSAPFHTASNLQSLPRGTEVLIVVSTTYWLGVETHDGQHGWMLRDELEPVE
jgi:hypothetical protein